MKDATNTAEKEEWVDHIIDTPGFTLGPRASYAYLNDPRRLAFMLARYKFCAKMLIGKKHILEVGCGDSFGSPVVAQECETMTGIDIEERLIEENKVRLKDIDKLRYQTCDITQSAPDGMFDGAISLDVLEHIPFELEGHYFENVTSVLDDNAIFIVGMPNITSDIYASKPGHSPHINLKDEKGIRESMGQYFSNVLVFSMNDEVVHTGFTPMAHYLFAVGIGKRPQG
ncbi:class I SAM-dependent methyltransferase [Alteromonas sp. ASW11-19]|uniref:Class I SAM-dependent methyltransferase n=1 Tax=Alteromonas salexigens TaxID=2982530 RepID=A0ABT2VPK8_9ALTE|nr:class I SAM-dependent methyltransferase [Alteromonas salexigens]MCU7555009.1 class I SAM-dependent methyltransferase [Alteromonas salexigens]